MKEGCLPALDECSDGEYLSCLERGAHYPGSHWLDADLSKRNAVAASQTSMSILFTDAEALLLHEGDGTLLHCIERILQSALTIDGVSEVITHISVDLIHGWPPLEIDIHLRGGLLEHRVDVLVTKEGLRAIDQRRS